MQAIITDNRETPWMDIGGRERCETHSVGQLEALIRYKWSIQVASHIKTS